jgi:hypothetical protein
MLPLLPSNSGDVHPVTVAVGLLYMVAPHWTSCRTCSVTLVTAAKCG